MPKYILILIIFFISSFCFGKDLKKIEPKKLTIFYSSNLAGEISPCGCSIRPVGGLARNVGVYKEEEKNNPSGILRLDSGDLFFPVATVADFMKEEMREKADFIRKIYNESGLEAITVGELDFALGADWLLQGNNIVSSNVFLKTKNELLFKPYKIVERAGIKIGIFGASDPALLATVADIVVQDSIKSLQKSLKKFNKLEKSIKIKILVLHGDVAFAKKISKVIRDFDFILAAHGGEVIETPIKINKTFIFEAGRLGKMIGKIMLSFYPKQNTLFDLTKTGKVLNEISWIKEDLLGYAKRAGLTEKFSNNELLAKYEEQKDIQKLLKNKFKQLSDFNLDLKKLPKINSTGFYHEIITLDEECPSDARVLEDVEKIENKYK